jgi:hypothetical protein
MYEWCLYRYSSYASSPITDPVGAATDSYRVLRGGDWSRYAQLCRSAYRNIIGLPRRPLLLRRFSCCVSSLVHPKDFELKKYEPAQGEGGTTEACNCGFDPDGPDGVG